MRECVTDGSKRIVGPLVLQLENVSNEPPSELRKRRIKNFHAQLQYHHIPLPAVRALLLARKRLRSAQFVITQLPPHRRVEVAQLAQAIGDDSDLFHFEGVKTDADLQRLQQE
jgi:hypothetical protein